MGTTNSQRAYFFRFKYSSIIRSAIDVRSVTACIFKSLNRSSLIVRLSLASRFGFSLAFFAIVGLCTCVKETGVQKVHNARKP
jgi:hypothetical protein